MSTQVLKDGNAALFYVQGTGTGADSAHPFIPYHLIGDGTNTIIITGSGAAKVDGSAVTQPVSGSINVNPATSGGLSIYRNINLVATGVNIKASAGQIYGLSLYNGATSARFVKIYNKATAPTVGTDTPVLTIPIPAGASIAVDYSTGIAFSSGIGIGATTAIADNSTAAPASNEVVVNVLYK